MPSVCVPVRRCENSFILQNLLFMYIYIYVENNLTHSHMSQVRAQLISCSPNLGHTGHRVDGDGDIERRNIPTNDSTALACLGCLRC